MPPSLDYARILYQDEFRFRSITVLALVLFWLMAGLVGYVAIVDPFGVVGSPVYMAVVVSALLALLTSGYLTYGVAADARRPFMIATDGIVVGGKLTPWSGIVAISAYVRRDGDDAVSLFFRKRAFGPPVQLMGGKPMGRVEYERLIELLRVEIGPLHPGLKLGGYEKEVG